MTWIRPLWKAALIVVALGVALMHATGHACHAGDCHTEVAAVVTHAEADPHEHEGHDGDPIGTGMSPVQMCMAVLTALALAMTLAAAWHLLSRLSAWHWAVRLRRVLADLPESLPPGGRLSFMELSVFRI